MERFNRFEGKRARLSTPKGEDGINELPDEILVLILSRLTLREAALTSVLSKRWRYLWTCISTLNFDDIENINSDLSRSEYINWVSCVLAQHRHRGRNIEEFRVHFDLTKTDGLHIDRWVVFALSNRVHTIELIFNLVHNEHSAHSKYSLDDEWHEDWRDVERLGGDLEWLGYHNRYALGLGSCLNNSYNMNPCMFVGFKSLKTLSLKAVNVGDEAVEYFLSNCPLLERLFLHDNGALRNLKVIGPSLVLRHLEVVRCFPVETIEICDTNLVSFTYAGNEPKILLKNAPLLVEVSINRYASIQFTKAMLPKLSCCFPHLEILQLTIHHERQESLRAYSLPELKNLKQFVMVVNRKANDCLLGFLAMIKNWPNLQRFVLLLRSQPWHKHDRERRAARRDLREAVEYRHQYLKVVEIAGYCNYSCDFELVKQIIENAVTLDKIIIDPRDPSVSVSVSESESESESEDEFRELQASRRRLKRKVAARRSSAEKQLRTQVPPGVELVML